MFCLITVGMTTAVSVAELPCSNFASVEPKQQIASLDQSFVPGQPKALEIEIKTTTDPSNRVASRTCRYWWFTHPTIH
jgi:hypothetical protein